MKIIFLDFDGLIRIPVPTGGLKIEAESSSMRERLGELSAIGWLYRREIENCLEIV